MRKNLVFIGLRGSGKSTFGRMAAQKWGYAFVDTDREIEQRAGKKVAEVVREKGWEYFRALEQEVCADFAKRQGTVIAVGGGVIMNPQNVEALKQNGIFIFLKVPLPELVRRLEQSKNKRPPLKPGLSLAEEVEAVWAERKERFDAVADVVLQIREFTKERERNMGRNLEELEKMLKEKGIL